MLEGMNWIVFLPNITTGVGAPNRYYGVFESGEIKSVEHRPGKDDTTTIVRELQQEMLDRLAKCKDSRSSSRRRYRRCWTSSAIMSRPYVPARSRWKS